MASNGYPQQGESASPATTTLSASQPSDPTAPSPDQVGWYFVEKYYTILAKTPDQVGLFYDKGSSLVWGTEGEVLPMVQGRHEISDRIKSLGFKDCKVRVTNVDSQASASGGILIQVIGEMTNNQEPCRRFTQTFFLAEQPNGYFVLNDILRYLEEEEEEEQEGEEEGEKEEEERLLEENAEEEVILEEEEAAPKPDDVPAEETPVEEPVQESEDTSSLTETAPEPGPTKPEEPVSIAPAVPEIPAAVPTVNEITNGTPAVEEEAGPEPEPEPEPVAEELETVPEPSEEALPSPSVPKAEFPDATPAHPTPAATPPPQQPLVEKPAAPAPAPAPVPTKPTWASVLGSTPKPTVPVTSQAPQTTQAPPVFQQPIQIPQSSTAATATTPASASGGQGWQSVSDSSRRYPRSTSVAGAGDLQNQAYIRPVSESVDVSSLREALAKFGSIKNFDVRRNYAIVEFDTAASAKAAMGASPLRIGDQNIYVEERQPNRMGRPGGHGPRSPAGGQRGERQGQGRGGFPRAEGRFDRDSREGGRGGARGSSRAFPPRSRSGATPAI